MFKLCFLGKRLDCRAGDVISALTWSIARGQEHKGKPSEDLDPCQGRASRGISQAAGRDDD